MLTTSSELKLVTYVSTFCIYRTRMCTRRRCNSTPTRNAKLLWM